MPFKEPISIKQAMEKISNKSYLLPAFQREFVWTSSDIENLFDSIMQGYPIGSMLFWKVIGEAREQFQFYPLIDHFIERYHSYHRSPQSIDIINDFWAVLDGQQRLTALYLGLCGSYAYHGYRKSWDFSEASFPTRHLYLNLTDIKPVDENDKVYDFKFLDKKETKQCTIFTNKQGEKWLKVSWVLNKSPSTIKAFMKSNQLNDNEKKCLKRLDDCVNKNKIIHFFEEETSEPDKAVNIFVRINTGGHPLSFSDMLLSLLIASWKEKDARTEIRELTESINNKGFNIGTDYVLKAILFLYHSDVRFKIKNFTNEFIETIDEKWPEISCAIEELFSTIKSFGLNYWTLTSNNATLPILSYIYFTNKYQRFSTSISYLEDRKNIKKWLFQTLVLRTFGASSDHVLQQSKKIFSDSRTISQMAEFPSKELNVELKQTSYITDKYIDENLLTIQKDQKQAYALLALLFHTEKGINYDIDHLHPKDAWTTELGIDWNLFNSIVNLQLLDENSNRSKQNMPLKDWVSNELNSRENKIDRHKFLSDRYIPEDTDLSLSNFNNFAQKRKKLLRNAIKEVLDLPNSQNEFRAEESDSF